MPQQALFELSLLSRKVLSNLYSVPIHFVRGDINVKAKYYGTQCLEQKFVSSELLTRNCDKTVSFYGGSGGCVFCSVYFVKLSCGHLEPCDISFSFKEGVSSGPGTDWIDVFNSFYIASNVPKMCALDQATGRICLEYLQLENVILMPFTLVTEGLVRDRKRKDS